VSKRNVFFEQVVFCIENGMLLDVIEHPNPDKYNRQKIYVIEINNYVYLKYLSGRLVEKKR